MAFPEDPERTEEVDLAELRRRYTEAELDERDMSADPLEQFRRWLHIALESGLAEPNAMVLATAGADGSPSARTVLAKGVDERGFTFYTNLGSAKAADLAANPVAEVVFPWHPIERQVRVTGAVVKVARDEVDAYFASRPRESRLGAWASRQSAVVPDRETLDRSYSIVEERWPEGTEIPVPEFWGGYRLVPERYEFWQGRVGRLHDRIRYRWEVDHWIMERLAP